MVSEPLILVKRVGTAANIALVTLNSPTRLNAISRALERELGDRMREVWRCERFGGLFARNAAAR